MGSFELRVRKNIKTILNFWLRFPGKTVLMTQTPKWGREHICFLHQISRNWNFCSHFQGSSVMLLPECCEEALAALEARSPTDISTTVTLCLSQGAPAIAAVPDTPLQSLCPRCNQPLPLHSGNQHPTILQVTTWRSLLEVSLTPQGNRSSL